RLMGPNCLGFLNYNDGVALMSMRGLLPRQPGRIGMVTASGSNGNMSQLYGSLYGICFGHVISTGNEADIDIAEVIDFLVDDPATRAVAVYAETIRNPARFAAAARRALVARKPVVILKIGAGESAAAVAAAHTGAAMGDLSMWRRVIEIVSRDPQIGLTVCNTEVPTDAGTYHATALELVGEALRSVEGPSAIVTSFPRPHGEFGREALARAG